MSRKAIEKRIAKLETVWVQYGFEGIMPDGEERFFDAGKFLNLLFENIEIDILQKRSPTLADFSEEDQKFMKEFIRADLPKNNFIPMTRRYFATAEAGDLSIKEQPLEDFVEPVDWKTLGIKLNARESRISRSLKLRSI
jgi:hypothetical protein